MNHLIFFKSIDEIFIQFHQRTDKDLAPLGVSRVECVVKFDDKIGFGAMPTLAKFGNDALQPFIIFIFQWQINESISNGDKSYDYLTIE